MQHVSNKSGFHLKVPTYKRGLMFILYCFMATFLVMGCFRKEILTVEITVPQMRSEECAQHVANALRRLEAEALRDVQLDIERRVARITYDSTRLGLKNLEYALTTAGFNANDKEAEPVLREALPEGCR